MTILCIAVRSSGSADIFYGYRTAYAIQMWTVCHVLFYLFVFALMPISTWLFLEKEHVILYCHYSCNTATKRQSHWFDWSARVYPFSLHVHKCSRGRCIGRCKSLWRNCWLQPVESVFTSFGCHSVSTLGVFGRRLLMPDLLLWWLLFFFFSPTVCVRVGVCASFNVFILERCHVNSTSNLEMGSSRFV